MLQTPIEEIPQLENAVHAANRTYQSSGLMLMFWGLIIAKCLLVQWAIFTYRAPINGWLFVWTPSIAFGILCSLAYLRYARGAFWLSPLGSHTSLNLWFSISVVSIFVSVSALEFHMLSPFLLPAFFSLLMGLGYFTQGSISHLKFYKILGINWWIGATFLITHPDVDALTWLAGFIIFLQVLPSGFIFWGENKKMRRIKRRYS